MSKLRLLLVSGASQVGQSVLAALAGRRANIEVAATGSAPSELALFEFDATYVMPETAHDPEAFAKCLLAIVARTSPVLLIPCRDDDVVALSDLRARRPDLMALCGSSDAARVMADKWQSASFATAHGLPFAPTLIVGSGQTVQDFVRAHGYPLIAKPRESFASRGVFLVRNDEQLERVLVRDGYLVQKFLGDPSAVHSFCDSIEQTGIPLFHSFEGTMRSQQALIGPDGTIAQVVCTTTAMRHGRSERLRLDPDPQAHALGMRCARAFSEFGWRGPLNVQCQAAPDGELFIHEFNGRFTGATAARRLLGRDEVGPAVALFTGQELPADRALAVAPDEVVRVPVAVAADPEHSRTLRSAGEWRRGTTANA